MYKVRLNKIAKIEKAGSLDTDRPTLAVIHYNAKKQFLVTADGCIMAVHPLRPRDFAGGRCPGEDMEIAVEEYKRVRKERGEWAHLTGPAAKFPRVMTILSSVVRIEAEPLMLFDMKLLERLSHALCESNRLRFVGVYRQKDDEAGIHPLLVIPIEQDFPQFPKFGLLMPIRGKAYNTLQQMRDRVVRLVEGETDDADIPTTE